MTTRILTGDVRAVLATLLPESVHCVVTSPPYYGLRDYGATGQIGLEPTLAEYLDTMVEVCRAIRRVLRKDGTFWLNIGDSYAGGGRGGNPDDSLFRKQATNAGSLVAPSPLPAGLKPKDLMMVPHRLALALQADGWWVRSDIAWCKRAPMPESCADRPTSAWEHVWLLAKGQWKSRIIKFSDLDSERVHLGQYFGTNPTYSRGVQICVTLARAIFNRAQEQNGFRLPPFYSEVWQQGADQSDSDFVRGLPSNARPAVWAARFCSANTTAEEFLHKVNRLPVALLDRGDLLVGRTSAEGDDPPLVNCDREGTVTIHDAGQISEIDFAHDRIVHRNPTTCSYFYDAEAIREPFADERHGADGGKVKSQRNRGGRSDGFTKPSGIDPSANGGRNQRNFWLLGPEPFSEWGEDRHGKPISHFATFPTRLVEPCILAGTSAKGVCPQCGAPWARVIERESRPNIGLGVHPESGGRLHRNPGGGVGKDARRVYETGWRAACRCDAVVPIPATVLDPFGGSGTTGLVADRLGRDCILIDLNPGYADMARNRIADDAGLFAEVAAE